MWQSPCRDCMSLRSVSDLLTYLINEYEYSSSSVDVSKKPVEFELKTCMKRQLRECVRCIECCFLRSGLVAEASAQFGWSRWRRVELISRLDGHFMLCLLLGMELEADYRQPGHVYDRGKHGRELTRCQGIDNDEDDEDDDILTGCLSQLSLWSFMG